MTWSWLAMLKYIESSHLAIFGCLYKSKSLKNMGTCYVEVYVAFKAAIMTFPILGGLFQVYGKHITNLNGRLNDANLVIILMWTSPETPARTHYMFQIVQ